MAEQLNAMVDSVKLLWNQMVGFLPRLIVGIVLFIIGWVIAGLFRKGLIRLFTLVRLDVFAERIGIEGFLVKGGAQYTTVKVLANLIYWFVMFALTMAVLQSFGVEAARELFARLLSFIPAIVVAGLVLVFGTLFAKLVRGAAFTYLTNVRITGAEFVSNIVYWAILFLVVSVTLQQLSLGGQALISAFEIAFAGLCLALAIAFGLAGKEWATQILEKLWRNSR